MCSRLVCSLTRLGHRLGHNELGPEGAKHISEALKTNSALQTLECAAARPILYCQ